MRRVIVESPYKGDVERNERYARACLLDSLKRGEAPLASHLLYTQVLDDKLDKERRLGMKAGHAWIPVAECMVIYTDLGESDGVFEGLKVARLFEIPVEFRAIDWTDSTDSTDNGGRA